MPSPVSAGVRENIEVHDMDKEQPKQHKILKKAMIGAAVSLSLILFDQLTKYWALTGLKWKRPFVIWDGVFELRYLENRGAAFGILQDQKWLLVAFTIASLAVLVYFYLRKIPSDRKFFFFNLVAILFFSGAAGNLIDRVRQDYVIDFFYFSLIDFPVFNVADIYVVAGALLLVVLGVFHCTDEEWEQVFSPKKKEC